MIPQKSDLCSEATEYYFDIARGLMLEKIPVEVIAHVQQCCYCNSEIEQLKLALNSKEDDKIQKQKDDVIAAVLELHYAYTRAAVTCNEFKPFLPGLADPALQIRVPTPITAHIDNCQQCADDLKAIRKLNLTHKQLCRLGQLFAERPMTNPSMCADAKKAMPFVARLDFEGLPPEILKHLCLCNNCRERLANLRNSEMQRAHEVEQAQPFKCIDVLASDIFDFAIPYGLDLQNHQNTDSRKSLISHLANCSDCFKKIQDLHSTVFQILKRSKSGTVTKFQIDNSVKEQKDLPVYAGRPIRVDVTHKFNAWSKLEKRLTAANLRLLIKPAAAALILVTLSLYFFSTTMAHAVALEDIYSAVAKIANIHISSFVPDKKEPAREQWISKTLGISIGKKSTEIVLWNIKDGSRRIKNSSTGKVEISRLSSESIADLNKNIDITLSLMPFNEISELPQNSTWQQATDVNNLDVNHGIKVYALTWTEKLPANLVKWKKWQVFIDLKTGYPQKIEWYEKADEGDRYILKSYLLIDYPNESKMQAVIRDAAF